MISFLYDFVSCEKKLSYIYVWYCKAAASVYSLESLKKPYALDTKSKKSWNFASAHSRINEMQNQVKKRQNPNSPSLKSAFAPDLFNL